METVFECDLHVQPSRSTLAALCDGSAEHAQRRRASVHHRYHGVASRGSSRDCFYHRLPPLRSEGMVLYIHVHSTPALFFLKPPRLVFFVVLSFFHRSFSASRS